MNEILNSNTIYAISVILIIALSISGWLLAFLVSKMYKTLDAHNTSINRINEWIGQQSIVNNSIREAISVNNEQEKKINELIRRVDKLTTNMNHCKYKES